MFPSADAFILNLSCPKSVTVHRLAQFEDHALNITDLCRRRSVPSPQAMTLQVPKEEVININQENEVNA